MNYYCYYELLFVIIPVSAQTSDINESMIDCRDTHNYSILVFISFKIIIIMTVIFTITAATWVFFFFFFFFVFLFSFFSFLPIPSLLYLMKFILLSFSKKILFPELIATQSSPTEMRVSRTTTLEHESGSNPSVL